MAQNRPQVTYKGITLETQEAVRKAARAAGMTIGAWVEETLLCGANKVRESKKIADEGVADRLIRVETMLRILMEDYYDRHPEARPSITSLTHTGRIAAGME